MKKNSSHLLTFFALLLGCAIVSHAAQLRGELLHLRWFGTDNIPVSQRARAFPLQEGDDVDSLSIVHALDTAAVRLARTGYSSILLDSAVWTPKQFGGDLFLYWSSSGINRLTSFHTSGDTAVGLKVDTSGTTVFDPDVISSQLDDWIDQRSRQGYPLASMQLDSGSIIPDSHTVSIKLHAELNRGQPVDVNDLVVKGGEGIRQELWRRESRLVFPFRYNPDKIAHARRYLLATERFDDLGNPDLVKFGPTTLLRFNGKIRYPTQIDGVIGYLPARGAESATITGKVHLAMSQLFGSFRRVTLDWSKPDNRSQDFSFQYVEPWVFKVPLALQASIAVSVQDTLYSEFRADLKGIWQFNEFWTGGLGGFVRQVSADSAAQTSLGFSQLSAKGITMSATYDNRDRPNNPREGLYGSVNWEWSRRQDGDTIQKSTDLEKIVTTMEQSIPLDRSYSLLLGVRAGDLDVNDSLPLLPDLFTVGGPGSVRGYREKEFYATRYVTGTIEPRWLLLSTSRAYLFVDGGFVERRRGSIRNQTTLAGWGMGMLIGLKSSQIGLDLGWGRNDTPLDGKVSFRLIQDF